MPGPPRPSRSAPPSGRPAPPRPAPPAQYLGPSTVVPAQPAPTLFGTVGQWGRGTGLREAEGGRAGREVAPGWVSFRTRWQQRTSRRCECGSWSPAPVRGPVKCVCFLLAWALNGEELSLNGNLPLPWLEAGSPALQEGSLPSQPPGKSNFSIYRSSLKHLVCKES